MKRIKFLVTVEELRLLASLASDQLFRRQFIDPKMPGYKGRPEEVDLGKALVGRMRLVLDGGIRHTTAALARNPPSKNGGDCMKNIFVGNLNSGTTRETIRSLFTPHGTVRKFKLMTDTNTGLSRGFAFVEMAEVEAGHAMAALDGRIVDGQAIKVWEGRPELHGGPVTEHVAPQPPEPRML